MPAEVAKFGADVFAHGWTSGNRHCRRRIRAHSRLACIPRNRSDGIPRGPGDRRANSGDLSSVTSAPNSALATAGLGTSDRGESQGPARAPDCRTRGTAAAPAGRPLQICCCSVCGPARDSRCSRNAVYGRGGVKLVRRTFGVPGSAEWNNHGVVRSAPGCWCRAI